MTHIQILENENHTSLADFNNNEVWILSCNGNNVDDRIINCKSVTELQDPLSFKFPLLLSKIIEKHGSDFSYEII